MLRLKLNYVSKRGPVVKSDVMRLPHAVWYFVIFPSRINCEWYTCSEILPRVEHFSLLRWNILVFPDNPGKILSPNETICITLNEKDNIWFYTASEVFIMNEKQSMIPMAMHYRKHNAMYMENLSWFKIFFSLSTYNIVFTLITWENNLLLVNHVMTNILLVQII